MLGGKECLKKPDLTVVLWDDSAYICWTNICDSRGFAPETVAPLPGVRYLVKCSCWTKFVAPHLLGCASPILDPTLLLNYRRA
jgi:hypothetical protein